MAKTNIPTSMRTSPVYAKPLQTNQTHGLMSWFNIRWRIKILYLRFLLSGVGSRATLVIKFLVVVKTNRATTHIQPLPFAHRPHRPPSKKKKPTKQNNCTLTQHSHVTAILSTHTHTRSRSYLPFPVFAVAPVLPEVDEEEDADDEEDDAYDGPARATLAHPPSSRLVLVYRTLYPLVCWLTHLHLFT